MTTDSYLLTLSCANQPGIVARVSTELFKHGGNILEAHQFDDTETGKFFMRITFNLFRNGDVAEFARAFEPIAAHYGMTWQVRSQQVPRKVLILVSKFDHCLMD